MISVIIATKNRDEALRDISLPSLLAQDTIDFEVIVWDASDNDRSEKVAGDYASRFGKKGVLFRYYKAPRVGSASQRNDAVSEARGDFVFFIDDDCEVSSDGLTCLEKCFTNNPACMGAGLRLMDGSNEKGSQPSLQDQLKETLYTVFAYVKKRKVHPSGSNKGISAPPGPAEWLSGGAMAFRGEIFHSMKFNEKLQTFGGYAMSEDVEFSHRVFLHFSTPLLVHSVGYVIHHEAPQARDRTDEKRIAMFFYNRYLVMQTASVRAPLWGRVAFSWNIMRRFLKMALRYGFRVTGKGFVLAVRQIHEDKKNKRSVKKTSNKELPR